MAKCYVSTIILLSPLHRSTTIRHTRLSDLTPIELASPVQNFATVHYDIYTYIHIHTTCAQFSRTPSYPHFCRNRRFCCWKACTAFPAMTTVGICEFRLQIRNLGHVKLIHYAKSGVLNSNITRAYPEQKRPPPCLLLKKKNGKNGKSVGCAFKNRRLCLYHRHTHPAGKTDGGQPEKHIISIISMYHTCDMYMIPHVMTRHVWHLMMRWHMTWGIVHVYAVLSAQCAFMRMCGERARLVPHSSVNGKNPTTVATWRWRWRGRMLDVGCWMLDVGCWMLDVGINFWCIDTLIHLLIHILYLAVPLKSQRTNSNSNDFVITMIFEGWGKQRLAASSFEPLLTSLLPPTYLNN